MEEVKSFHGTFHNKMTSNDDTRELYLTDATFHLAVDSLMHEERYHGSVSFDNILDIIEQLCNSNKAYKQALINKINKQPWPTGYIE